MDTRRLRVGKKGFVELGGEWGGVEWGGGCVEAFELAGDLAGFDVAEHAEGAGKLVCGGVGFGAEGFVEGVGAGGFRGAGEEIDAGAEGGEVALPEVGDLVVDADRWF